VSTEGGYLAHVGRGDLSEGTGHADEKALSTLGEIYSAGGRKRLPAERAALQLGECLVELEADAGFIATVSEDGRTVEVVRVTAYSQDFVRLAFPIDAPYPLAAVLRDHRSLYLGSNAEVACDHPGLVRLEPKDHACATVPLVDDGDRVVGAMNITFDEPRTFSDHDQVLVREIASTCAAALTDTETAA
jgi:GAF domain-containing protein